MQAEDRAIARGVIVVITVVSFFLLAGMGILPVYKVWQRGLSGKAQLQEAEYGTQVRIEQARSQLAADSLLAKAEVIRAAGVAQANEIIAGGLKENHEYLQYLAIQAQREMAHGQNHTTVYIPAGELGIPLIRQLE